MMSKQLAVSSAFSVLVMAAYVLFGGQAVRDAQAFDSAPVLSSPVEVSVHLPETGTLLPALR